MLLLEKVYPERRLEEIQAVKNTVEAVSLEIEKSQSKFDLWKLLIKEIWKKYTGNTATMLEAEENIFLLHL